ncbi:hypothetical protein SDJN02_13960, partial [Cucurbita argyrosperma subsp. argyrosperma]
ECLDLKEAISSVLFLLLPRCADLTELLQVRKISCLRLISHNRTLMAADLRLCGTHFSATSELSLFVLVSLTAKRRMLVPLVPLIELLSVRAPSPEKKLKLLKEIAEEHDVDWDPAGTEAEFNKSPEDLLNGSAQFVSASKLPLPQEKHNEAYNAPQPDSDSELDMLDFPEVPKISVSPHSTIDPGSASSMIPPPSTSPPPETTHDSSKYSCIPKTPPEDLQLRRGEVTPVRSVSPSKDQMNISVGEDKQFLPFIAPPSRTPEEKFSFKPQFEPEINSPPPSVSRTPDEKFGLKYEQEIISPPPSGSRTKSDVSLNLQDVLAAAQAAVETAERAAAAARSAASLTKVRIDTLTMKTNDQDPEICCENPFHGATTSPPDHEQTFHLNQQDSIGHHSSSVPYYSQDSFQEHHKESPGSDVSDHHRFESQKSGFDSSPGDSPSEHITIPHQPQRRPSMDDDPYFSYPNLFTSQKPNPGFDHSSADGS